MKCDLCNKEATVHLTEIIDDQMTEMHLCEDCAKKKSTQMEQQFGLSDLLAGLADFGKQVKVKDKEVIVCKNCGTTYEDFKKFGRLGCSECYEAFKTNLNSLLKKIHGSNTHSGKTPIRMPRTEKKKIETLQELKSRLLQAIQVEDYEKAAELRDKIRGMEKKPAAKKSGKTKTDT